MHRGTQTGPETGDLNDLTSFPTELDDLIGTDELTYRVRPRSWPPRTRSAQSSRRLEAITLAITVGTVALISVRNDNLEQRPSAAHSNVDTNAVSEARNLPTRQQPAKPGLSDFGCHKTYPPHIVCASNNATPTSTPGRVGLGIRRTSDDDRRTGLRTLAPTATATR